MNASAVWTSAGRSLSGANAPTTTLHAPTRPLTINSLRTSRLGRIGVTRTAGRSDAIARAVASDGWNAAPIAIRPSVATAIAVIARSRLGPRSAGTRVATQP